MFLDIEEFVRAVLVRKPSIGLITWTSKPAIASLVSLLGPTILKVSRTIIFARINGVSLDSAAFEKKLLEKFTSEDAKKTVLLIYEIESMAPTVGAILNGYREKLSQLRAVVLVIRENRYRDLFVESPDLMDWIGLTVAHAEQLAPPLTLAEVNSSIKKLEKSHGMTSKVFGKKWATGAVQSSDDKWLWNELIALRAELRRAE